MGVSATEGIPLCGREAVRTGPLPGFLLFEDKNGGRRLNRPVQVG